MTLNSRRFAGRAFLPRRPSLTIYLCLALFVPWDFATMRSSLHLHAAASATPDSRNADTGTCWSREEHLRRLGVAAWHETGFRGRGVKVAVLDSGFSGYREHLGHALPEQVRVKSFRRDGNLEAKPSQHGILCGEVVHALAPDAEMLLANWEPDRPDQFLDAVRWATKQGARVITCSVITPTWSDCEGGGSVHRELARILGAGDRPGHVLFFACAGNTAQRHWSGAFHDAGSGWHEWAAGCRDNGIVPWAGDGVSVELCCAAKCRLELSVYDATAQEKVGSCVTAEANEHGCAVVHFVPHDNHTYTARVHAGETVTGRFHLVVLGAGLHFASAPGSVAFPGDGAEVIAVGAVEAGGQRAPYSSFGQNDIDPKPDFVAPVPFASAWRDRAFSGTSAAAPQAAGLACLLWSKHPEWTAHHVRSELENDADQLAKTRPDPETGYGCIHAP
jgi:subtilisin family serine protease